MLLRSELFSALALPIGLGLFLHAAPGFEASPPVKQEAPSGEVSFSEQIQPIFETHCTECHSASSPELGLNLSTYEGTMAGSDYGTVIEPGNPDASLIIDMIASGDMPQGAPNN
jgi:hypothetical protein